MNIHLPPVFPLDISVLHHSAYLSVWLSAGPSHPGGLGHLVFEPPAPASYLFPYLNHFAVPEENSTTCNSHLAAVLRKDQSQAKNLAKFSIFSTSYRLHPALASSVSAGTWVRHQEINKSLLTRRKKDCDTEHTVLSYPNYRNPYSPNNDFLY